MPLASSPERLAPPVLSGLIAAMVCLLSALGLAVIPAIAAQAGSGGGMGLLDAILLGLSALVLAHGGSLVLPAGTITGSITLLPLGLTALLAIVAGLAMRRAARSLLLVQDDGRLRPHALRDAATSLALFVAVYAAGIGLLAAMARTPLVQPVIASAVVSALLLALLGGAAGCLAALRRPAHGSIPAVRLLDLIPSPWGALVRALGIALLGLLASGMLACTVMIAVRLSAISALFGQLAPGAVGGAVLTLLQLALLPLAAVWAVVVLLGGTVAIGTGTAISLGGTTTGVLPALPLLAIVPSPGASPWWFWLLALLPVAAIAAGAVRLADGAAAAAPRERWILLLAYPVLLIAVILVLASLCAGRIGQEALAELGPQVGTLLLPLTIIVAVTSALTCAICMSPALPWIRGQLTGLRARVEQAEAVERAERPAAQDPAVPMTAAGRERRAAMAAEAAALTAHAEADPASEGTDGEESSAASEGPGHGADVAGADDTAPDGTAPDDTAQGAEALESEGAGAVGTEAVGPDAAHDGTGSEALADDPEEPVTRRAPRGPRSPRQGLR